MVSLACYSLSLFAYHHAYPIAAKVYNDLCSSRGITFHEEWYSTSEYWIALIVLAVPVLLARSRALVVANLVLGLISALVAASLLTTAGNTPYECFTVNGWYEDRTSGLDDVDWWLLFAAFLSYALLLIDLAIWGFMQARRGWPGQARP